MELFHPSHLLHPFILLLLPLWFENHLPSDSSLSSAPTTSPPPPAASPNKNSPMKLSSMVLTITSATLLLHLRSPASTLHRRGEWFSLDCYRRSTLQLRLESNPFCNRSHSSRWDQFNLQSLAGECRAGTESVAGNYFKLHREKCFLYDLFLYWNSFESMLIWCFAFKLFDYMLIDYVLKVNMW